jgi:hypothetical protein
MLIVWKKLCEYVPPILGGFHVYDLKALDLPMRMEEISLDTICVNDCSCGLVGVRGLAESTEARFSVNDIILARAYADSDGFAQFSANPIPIIPWHEKVTWEICVKNHPVSVEVGICLLPSQSGLDRYEAPVKLLNQRWIPREEISKDFNNVFLYQISKGYIGIKYCQ